MNINMSKIGEKLLLMGFFLTPFTTLRFGFAGLGEILILCSALIALHSGGGKLRLDTRIQIFYLYWTALLAIMILGLYYNNLFFFSPSGRPGTPVFDFFAYVFVLISIVVMGHYSHKKVDFAMNFFRRLFLYWSLVYVALYVMSFFTPSIFGMPLRYHDFFSPLVENVHQAAMITCTMAFIALFLGMQSSVLLFKLLYYIIGVLFAMMALQSGSTKAMLGVVLGAIVSVTSLIMYRSKGKARLLWNLVSLCISIAIVILSIQYFDKIEFLAVQFFLENDGQGARGLLYRAGFEHGLDSLVVGFGPGSHTPYGGMFSDAHNTVLTIFLQSGILGLLVFVFLLGSLVRKLSVNFVLLGAFAAIGIYALGGDILRRLPIWIILLGMVYFASEVSGNSRAPRL